MQLLTRTPSFRGPRGEPLPGSIAEAKYVRLGGIEQWVLIRGENVTNPPLILLHGGPGFSETSLFRYHNAALERSFTVVYWDQRGAGKSLRSTTPRSSMTVEQLIADLDELVDLVRARLGKTKVTIFGHSWGSALGVLYCARFPNKVAAYVGSGQIGDWKTGEELSYAYAIETAQRLRKGRALKALRAIGPPPHSPKDLFSERTWVQRLDAQLSPKAIWKLGKTILGVPEASFLELPMTLRGFRSTVDAMWAEVSRLNLIELAPVLQVPTFFFLGRNDHFVPSAASLAYIEILTAPSKKIVWFETSGHEPFMDEPEKFNASMIEMVEPVARTRERGLDAAS